MIQRAINAAMLNREPYVMMVVRPDGVADGAIVVAVVHALLMIPLIVDGIGILTAARVILYGLVNWILLSGLVYLIGKHFLEGDGTLPEPWRRPRSGIRCCSPGYCWRRSWRRSRRN